MRGGGDNLFATQSVNRAGLGDLLGQDLQFVLFGGKGGVRKTTIAAATAIELAQRDHLYVLSQ